MRAPAAAAARVWLCSTGAREPGPRATPRRWPSCSALHISGAACHGQPDPIQIRMIAIDQLDDAAIVEDSDAVADGKHFFQLGGDVEHGTACIAQLEDALDHEARRARIESPGRLECDEDFRGAPELS